MVSTLSPREGTGIRREGWGESGSGSSNSMGKEKVKNSGGGCWQLSTAGSQGARRDQNG